MRRILLVIVLMMTTAAAWSQVTSSSITGVASDGTGGLPGASVLAVHGPSGTQYGTIANADGRFTLPNTRIGGPYTITITSIGYQASKVSDIYLQLGQPYIHNVTLKPEASQLEEVVVVADISSLTTSRTGASTNVSNRQITTLPTISRSITDYTRLTPQANGNSFGGRDGRYNNVQVDGANLNNNFGLSTDPLPGGGNSPISLDAYEEISVNIAPYDVRQSGFTGAGINAVTKSGTNTFKGTAYTFFRNQNMLGTKAGETDISASIVDSKNNIYGFSLGGPIIKDKLFFFVNGETEKGNRPGITFSPTGGSGIGTVSSTTVDSLQKLSDFLRDEYGYETGAFDNFPNFENENKKILAKIDWNINNNHRLTLKYSYFNSTNDQPLNGSSVPNGGGFNVTGLSNVTRLPFNRFSNTSMSFANSTFQFEDKVNTGTLEFNSNFGSKFSNQLLATITKINTTRVFSGPVFPTIDIFNGAGGNYMSAGMDPFTNNNDVVNDVYTFTDNFTYFMGKHTFTAGISYEFQKVGNMFMPGSNSYYAYNTLNDFITNQAPAYYAYTYSLVPGKKAVYSAELKLGQLGIYLQDEFNVNDKLKLTFGLRADKAIYLEDPIENPATSAQQFFSKDGELRNYSTGEWPSAPFLLSPRVGVRWDLLGDQSLIVRGGTGIFTGRIPFVFLTNIPTNSGMYQFGARLRNSNAAEATTLTDEIRFSSNPDEYADLFPTSAGTTPATAPVFVDDDFKFPQIFRTNLGIDKTLPYGFIATIDLMYSKDINAVRMRNSNFKPNTNGVVTEGGLSRPRYLTAADRNQNTTSSAIVLENTEEGYSTALTFQLSKAFKEGLYASVAYTYTKAEEVTANPGSQASSVWNANPNVGTSNAEELYNSQYAIPHRVIANVSYRKEYARFFASTLSLFYEGSHQGVYSFVVNGDLNGDGNNATDLMYIPRNASEMNFEAYSTTGANPVSFTVEQQEEAFEEFINNSPYLSEHRGEYAERNSALRPWLGRVDLRFLQDFFITTGKNDTRHTLQLSLDIFNFGNMLNKDWGVQQITTTNNPLVFRSINNTTENKPLYRLQNIAGELVTKPFQDLASTASTWSMQIGVRYSF